MFLTTFVSAAGADSPTAAALSVFLREKIALLERGYRDEDWSFMIEVAHDVLVRMPGEPTTLKWVGMALSELGLRGAALRSLEASLSARGDEQARETVAKLRARLITVRIDYSGLPPDGRLTDHLVTVGSAQLYRKTQDQLPRELPDEVRARLAQQIQDIQSFGGLPKSEPVVERRGGILRVTYSHVDPPPAGQLQKLRFELEKFGHEDVQLNLARADAKTAVGRVALRELATVKLVAVTGETVLIDGRPVTSSEHRLVPGRHQLVRIWNGLRWPSALTVAVGEKRLLSVTEPWPEVVIEGLVADDHVLVGGVMVPVEGDNHVRLPPGSHSLRVLREDTELPVDVVASVGQLGRATLPAILRVETDLIGFVLEVPGHEPWRVTHSGDKRIALAGELTIVARAPRSVPIERSVSALPGQAVTLHFPRNEFQLTDGWAQYERAKARRWRRGLGLTIASIVAAGLAAGGLGFWLDERSTADQAYSRYQAAVTTDDARFQRAETTSHATLASVWGGAAIGVGAVAAVLAATGVVVLARRLQVERPADESLSAPATAQTGTVPLGFDGASLRW